MEAYKKYKPSGIDWIGDVPEHWETVRLKYRATVNDEVLPENTDTDYEIEYVDIGSVDEKKGIIATDKLTFGNAPSRARRKVKDGDTIISTVRTYLRAITSINNPPENLVVSTGFAVVRPCHIDPKFFSYSLRENSFVESVMSRSVGVSYPAITATAIGDIGIAVPSLSVVS